MRTRATIGVAACVLLAFGAAPARATLNPLLLFGGPELQDFLGCVTCDAAEFYSIWNADSDYGSPKHPNSIWNRKGRYGSTDSPYSPWSRRPKSVPVVVDRAGNLCGNFAVDQSYPGRVSDGYLIWLLEGHDWIADHLDEVREEFRHEGPDRPPCGLPTIPGP
jgi:hypothetical protein